MNPLLLRGIGVSHGTTSWHPSFARAPRRAWAFVAALCALGAIGTAVGFVLGMVQV